MDYDDLWKSGSDYLCRWDGLGNSRLATLADYRAATDQEAHGLSQDPGLGAPATADFTPVPSSPLIDRGLHLPGINDGYHGLGPDIGAIAAPRRVGISVRPGKAGPKGVNDAMNS
jgi:hypothetical protein